MNLQKMGGIAALVEALAYIVGFTVMLTLLSPDNAVEMVAADWLAFNIEHSAVLGAWNLFIYVVFGCFLVVLVNALHERLKRRAQAMMSTASVFGFIWAGLVIASGMVANIGLERVAGLHASEPGQALVIWQSIGVVQDALGGGVEVVGGLWVLLLSWAALKQGALPRPLNVIGLLVGLAGILTAIPGLGGLGALFGLGQIPWFIWLGIFMLRNDVPDQRSQVSAGAGATPAG
ncbi:DUF4386 family protein [Microbulbifer sp. YPW16]|uniref:DUF4386 family protein n=1 Tax=Microbulbifer sp. YPW16 TaxID=2904242 RepID=UPI001E2FF7DB|nr:DUF4386 family protein [Microbulbifer sp. YPW16]UHQ53646.1 DUF4386 family protein [Microbulbifer sp. YPW16]